MLIGIIIVKWLNEKLRYFIDIFFDKFKRITFHNLDNSYHELI